MTDRFFAELRKVREARAISLEAISAATKIAPRHLCALERGELQELPGGIFRKGILRAYLDAVGVEAGPKLAEFERLLAAHGERSQPVVNLEEIAEGLQRSRGDRPGVPATRWPGVFAMLALLLMFGWCLWHFALRGHVLVSHLRGTRPTMSRRWGTG